MLKRIPIRLKLVLLAGVPVIGALILATMIARDALRQAESAAAIGSIEDLARVSAQMGKLVHALQFERNELSLRVAQKKLDAPELTARFAQSDSAAKELRDFLAARKVSKLPARLARDLSTANQQLGNLEKERKTALSGEEPIDELLSYYTTTTLALISATAALSQLTDDGELMRAISALVIVLQIKERCSQEHALLSHVFAINEFPPGTYKDLVTLTTEEADYVRMLNVAATDSVNQHFTDISRGHEFARTEELRKVALDTMSDDFHTSPEEWSRLQATKITRLRGMVVMLNEAIKIAALAKVAAATRSVRVSYGLAGGVIVLSALLAGLIARGISRSVGALAHAAEQVSQQKNFAIRAVKTSDDELGQLTDTLNEMLSGIQARDAELRHHGENLERLVEERTAALQKRNEAMRLVLDNVEQGLATVQLDGTLAEERSRAFDAWFGEGGASFAERLAGDDTLLCDTFKVGWEQVTDAFLPVECAIDQLPQHITVKGRRYDLRFKAIVDQEQPRGALLIVSDVTREMERQQRDAEQRELIGVFERFMGDRSGFQEFFRECETLVHSVTLGEVTQTERVLRALHTLKGNCGIFGVESVASVAHELESLVVETDAPPSVEQSRPLVAAWKAFADRVLRLSGAQTESVVEVTQQELQEIEASLQTRAPHTKLAGLLSRLKSERGVVRLRRVAEQARSLAQRLGKGELDVHIEAGPDVRFEAQRWAPFWASFVHVVRNAVDHGVESPQERAAAGKSARANLRLVARRDANGLTIEIIDDGGGIDWERVREKAQARGLPSAKQQDLVDALFCDGLSTAENVTDFSGRGIGMSAVRDAALQLDGIVTVSSTPGVGTSVRFRFPNERALDAVRASMTAR